jgi:outer membrane protein assembly factor BamB
VPRLIRQVPLGATNRCVVARDGVAFAGLAGGGLVAVDLFTGEILSRTNVLGSIEDVAFDNGVLYALALGRLHAIQWDGTALTLAGSGECSGIAASSGERRRLFAGDGRAYVTHLRGHYVLDLSNPLQPVAVAKLDTTLAGWKQIVPTSSGLALGVVGENSDFTGRHNARA